MRRAAWLPLVLLAACHPVPARLAPAAFGARRPAVVFEQFTATDRPIAPPAAGESLTVWLDSNGFDRRGWRWPLHEPVVTAALAVARGIWGSNVSREELRSVVTGGAAAAPEPLRRLMERAPLEGAAQEVRVAPEKRMLVVGLLEREEDGTAPTAAERRRYDLVVVTPRVDRPDPCAQLRRPGANP